ncbi:MAG TPA: thiamine-phosphate kinase [Gemmatimonadaceae bacterium]|nr:thiamine-phosphate kinase [Gemmatimonadaceae bacterium]
MSDGDARGHALPLGPGREFDVVRDFLRRWGTAARGIGGDCAELELPPGQRLVVSTDSSVEGVHFRREWLAPREIGYRAAAAALSDLAAAAAEPLGLLLALTVPDGWRADAGALADGVAKAALAAGAPIVGGDLSRGGELSLTVTVLGAAAHPLRRDGARAGDALFVTGALGGPGAAVRAWVGGGVPAAEHRERFAHPVPRLAEARWLRAHGATAAVDLSDGLAADAAHLAAASGVRLRLDVDAVPCVAGVRVEEALASGEEYELLVAAPARLDVAAFARAFGLPLTRVGRVEAGAPGVAARVDLPHGHDHFSR